MKFENKALFFDLLNLYGGPSAEDSVREYFKAYLKNYPQFQLITDRIGSVFAVKKSKTPNARNVVVAAHLDEVCFMVTTINSDGSLGIINLGAINANILFGTSLIIVTDNGNTIPGVIGAISPHLGKDKEITIKQLCVDIGCDSKEETIKLGVKPGDMVYFEKNAKLSANEKYIFSKSIDNRIGVGIVLSLIKKLSKIDFPFNLYLGCHSQEEVVLRGARTFSQTINPDLFFAVDTSPVNDVNNPEATVKLGKGILLRVYDPGNHLSHFFKSFLETRINNWKIPLQHYFAQGGTDAIAYLTANRGTLATSVVLPARYIHSQVGVCSISDINNVISFYNLFLTTLTNKDIIDLLNFTNEKNVE